MSDKKASTENSDELSPDELKAVAGGTGGAGVPPPAGGPRGGMPPSQFAPGDQPLPPMPGQGMVGFDYGGATGGDAAMPPPGGDPGMPPPGGDPGMPPPGGAPGMPPPGGDPGAGGATPPPA